MIFKSGTRPGQDHESSVVSLETEPRKLQMNDLITFKFRHIIWVIKKGETQTDIIDIILEVSSLKWKILGRADP